MLYGTLRGIGSVAGRVLYRPAIEGLENVPAHGPVILASNHLSFADSVVIPLVVPRRVRFLAKTEYFDSPGVKGRLSRLAFSSLGALPVKRGAGRDAMTALEAGLSVLRAGEAFGIYPEGTRSRDGRLYRGRTGVGHLALASGAPVVPVALFGTEHIQPVGARMPRLHPIRVRFGSPLDFSEGYGHLRPGQARRLVTDEVMAAIHALSGQARADHYNDPGVDRAA
ncbi:lysophospholipid acyltransferase family protein [Marinitenerispora sediminis]|uniref:1-acyl-sn-glycerol-3-phosphate acyltransferase n=1 Tax=Marinitenerispora sediminis TaxID=1931232 RepID=A0A368T7Q8_9ACTN|nr:lysophospholipid acyltransferase family protein [Marinitenerispora sediminis]RCV50914.1 1-acyl-sn-glycerol-3-phosphate acyltransferase [Marinitenerispora sediminis]RCV59726.1 1-acyl-sn-glycerol-3-phosphate acyltransferase [Marinitenerispora sediminis]RCV59822.1 1-acyl-sn-glycerol-3-phosphate acyltransferase [Marinitenerispora sediminis]